MADIIPINEKLRYVVSNSGLTDQDFAASVNIDRSQFGRILRGQLNITLKQLLEISSLYKVRCGWLLDDEPPVYKEKSGSLEKPDQQLLTQLRKEIDVLKASLLRLSDLVPSVQEESLDREVTYDQKASDKTRSTGKP